jgi:hypothetical protein
MTDFDQKFLARKCSMSMDPKRFQALSIASALILYNKTKMQINRQWTPKNMMQQAERLTEKKFKARAYLEAAQALREFAYQEEAKA